MTPLLSRLCLLLLLASALAVGCGQAPKSDTSRPLVDSDGDGYPAIRHGGRDCDDQNAVINPLAKEIPGNGLDDNCNGQEDEVTARLGHWRLTTPKQAAAGWHIDIRTDEKTGVQYVRCLQFSFQLQGKGVIFNLTQWQSNLPSSSIKIEQVDGKTKFKWVYDRSQVEDPGQRDTVKTEFTGEIKDTDGDGLGDSVVGKIIVEDVDPAVNTKINLDYTGKPEKPSANDERASKFCDRCYADASCPADKAQPTQ